MNSVGIIGAGAAGIMAALAAAEAGADVSLFEKNNIVGKKMGITGKGRCNLTNAAPITDFIGSTPGNGKFLYSVYQRFTNEDLLECLHSWGLETKVERGGRVFPQSDSAVEVRKLLYFKLKDFGVHLHLEEGVTDVAVHDGRPRITTAKGRYFFDKLIIATGGMSYPVTGSTGDGYTFAAGLGHTIQEPRPSLIPFVSPDTWVHELTGLALKNVDVTLCKC
uniref:aminoacetone oxidase family FAD-binding enzyme n=1 Tax=Megasphaera micronuciformis TaxID=187326 RepID=UPI004028DE91